jgi:hypothetical protein
VTAALLSAVLFVRSAAQRFACAVAAIFLTILKGILVVPRRIGQGCAEAASALRKLFAPRDRPAPPRRKRKQGADSPTRGLPEIKQTSPVTQDLYCPAVCAAFMRTQRPPWRLYYDVFRALHKMHWKDPPSMSDLKEQTRQLFSLYTVQHDRAPVTGLEASAAVANSTFFTYDNKDSRMAYFVSKVPKHAVVISQCLEAGHEHILQLLTETAAEGRPFVVASFGGGPSSDLFGFLLYLERTVWHAGYLPQGWPIAFHVFDLGPWEPFWTHIAEAIPKYFPSVKVYFHTADLASSDAALLVPPETQLLLFSYFIVEMTPFADGFTAFFTALVATVRPDALFVAMDNQTAPATALRKRLREETGLTVLLKLSDLMCVSYLSLMPKFSSARGPKWINATMILHLEIWKADRDPGGEAKPQIPAAVGRPLRGPPNSSPAQRTPPPAVPRLSTPHDTVSEDSGQ